MSLAPLRKLKASNPLVHPLPTTPPAVRAAYASSGAVSIQESLLDERATAHMLHYRLMSRGV